MAKPPVKEKLCCRKMDIAAACSDHWGMAKKTLYLGQWLVALGRSQADLAKAVGKGESYISLLCSGKRKSPGYQLLLDTSDFLGITVNDLFEPPPPLEAIKAAGTLTPAQTAALGRLLDEMGRGRRR